jgi:hypothetical protein
MSITGLFVVQNVFMRARIRTASADCGGAVARLIRAGLNAGALVKRQC